MPAGDSRKNKTGQAADGRALLLKPSTAEKILALLARFDLEPDPVQFDRFTRGGKVFFRYKVPPGTPAGAGGGGGSAGCIPWTPVFTNDAGQDYVRFELGLLNQTAAGNWNTPLAIGPTDTKWPVLDVTASNGIITGYDIALDSAPPTADTVQEDTPPDSFKIVLGVIDSLSACMAVSQNLEASAIELFRKSKSPVTVGEEPFTRVWRWKVNQNSVGEYAYVT
jgi:hypothetical protein